MAAFSDGRDGVAMLGITCTSGHLDEEVLPSHTSSACVGFTIELYLQVARFLGWHSACAFWSALAASVGAEAESWRMLIAALVHDRGHDNSFLADLSILREVERYKPCGTAYQELFPEMVKHAFAHIYPPDRILASIFAADDAALLKMVLGRQKYLHQPLNLDVAKLLAAIDHGAKRCLQILLEASLKTSSVVKIMCPAWQPISKCEEKDDHIDFSSFPMCLLWRAAANEDVTMSEIVLCHLLIACGVDSANDLRLWAACCGVASGNERVLSYAGQAVASDEFSRVSFSSPQNSRGKVVEFKDSPLPVIAASCGHSSVLRMLAKSGVDFHLCNRRGVSVWDAAGRHSPGPLRESLYQALHAADPLANDPSSDGGACSDPLQCAIVAGDLQGLRSLISRGARLEGSDIMSAVRSGDLDVLSFVQDECKKNAGTHAEYRKMVKATATQIRIETRARHSLPNFESSRELATSHSQRLPRVSSKSLSRPSTPAHDVTGSRTPVLPPLRPDSRGSRQRPSSGQLGGSTRQAGDSIFALRQFEQRRNTSKLGR